MTSPELERLADRRLIEREQAAAEELEGHVLSGQHRLGDATNPSLSLESRFTLAYDAAHAFALAALRRAGYRSASRYLVFLCLPAACACPSSMIEKVESLAGG
ncbi:MAG TPA: hypothetical protein VN811_08035 [Thermoanaerobaculia bacterium]|nr:hypothetical protein [Thermoanaerobaculia bacterium]